MQGFFMGAGVVILIIIGSAIGAQVLFKSLEASKECRANSDCLSNNYCGSDFKCHPFPNPQQPPNYTLPALILSIGMILAMMIYKRQHPPVTGFYEAPKRPLPPNVP